jgi:hypothetical protein
MEVIHNIDGSFCNCDFEWVVIDENGYSVFGSDTEEKCVIYKENFPK